MHSQKLSFALLCLVLFVPAVCLAQEAISARITISVTDPAGAFVPQAQIRVVPPPDAAPPKMVTDSKGQLSLDLKLGGHALFITTQGFKNVATHIEVRESKDVQIIPVVLRIGDTASPMVLPSSYADALHLSAFPYHEEVWLKPAEFKAMPHTTVTVRNPHTDTNETYSGVTVASLFTKLGAPLGKEFHGIALTSYLIAFGSDGYQVVLALAEADPAFHLGEVLVADTMNGHPLDAKSGPFKLVVTEDKRPARWVRNLDALELKSVN